MGGLAVLDDIRLIAPGPQTVAGGQAQRFGAAGMNDFNYWIVAHYPIGISISGPFFIRDAPNVLDPANYVLIVWDRSIGAESYDVLRTATAEFPQGSGFFAVATGLTQTTTRDQGQALSFYAPPAPPQSPATCRIHLNNRDYAQPTLQMPCSIAVTSIIFADGTQQTTAATGGGGQNQSPWLSDIDGAGFTLNNAGAIAIGAAFSAAPFANGSLFIQLLPASNAGIQIVQSNSATSAVISLINNFGLQFQIGFGGSTAQTGRTNIAWMNASQIALQATGSEILRVAPAGVGVKNTSPVYVLDVGGSLRITGGAGGPGGGSGFNIAQGLPISSVNAGDVWSNGGVLTIGTPNGQALTPWGTTINGNNNDLNMVRSIGIGANSSNFSPLTIQGLPTSPTGLTAGNVWNNGGVLNIV